MSRRATRAGDHPDGSIEARTARDRPPRSPQERIVSAHGCASPGCPVGARRDAPRARLRRDGAHHARARCRRDDCRLLNRPRCAAASLAGHTAPDRLVRLWEEYPGGVSPAGNRWLSRSTYAVLARERPHARRARRLFGLRVSARLWQRGREGLRRARLGSDSRHPRRRAGARPIPDRR